MPFLGVRGGEHLRAGGPVCPCVNWALSPPAPAHTPTPAWSAGIIEGFKEEKAGLQEALGQKEASERDLVGELEGLRQQLQRAARRQAELREENAERCSQTEALARAIGVKVCGALRRAAQEAFSWERPLHRDRRGALKGPRR